MLIQICCNVVNVLIPHSLKRVMPNHSSTRTNMKNRDNWRQNTMLLILRSALDEWSQPYATVTLEHHAGLHACRTPFVADDKCRSSCLVMVARSSDSKSEATFIFYGCFFFSLATLSQTSDNQHSWNFPTRCGLVFNRTFAIPISSKCPLKRTGPKNWKFAPFYMPSCRQLAP